MANPRVFKPNLMAGIALLSPSAAFIGFGLIPWMQGDTFPHAAKVSLLWLGLSSVYVLALSPMYSYRLAFEDAKVVSQTWYAKREVVYADIEKIEMYVRGPYGALALRIKEKGRKLP